MRRRTGMLMVLVAALVFCASCQGPTQDKVSTIIKSGEWIYYTNITEGALFRMKTDMTEKAKVADIADYFVVDDEVVYYFDTHGDICRVGIDGNGYAKLVDLKGENAFTFHVAGGWIYYGLKSGSICKVSTNGSQPTIIAEPDEFVGEMLATADWIFYKDGSGIYRMKPDGTARAKLADNAGLYTIYDDWIYYGVVTEREELHDIIRVKPDGTEKSLQIAGMFVAIDEDRLYYLREGWLYRANLDGSLPEKINNLTMFNIRLIDENYIYYTEMSEKAYRISLAGEGKTPIE